MKVLFIKQYVTELKFIKDWDRVVSQGHTSVSHSAGLEEKMLI